MNGPALLADHLDTRTSAILALWRATIAREGDVPEAERLSYKELVDHIPALLDHLADRLRGTPSSGESDAKTHGIVRWRQGYDIAAVVRELGHLRTALRKATFGFAQEQGFELSQLESTLTALDDVLDEVTADSVSQFQDESHTQIHAALENVKVRGHALEVERSAAEVERTKLRTVLDSLPVGVWVLDAEGVIRSVNREAERLQGFPASEVVGRVVMRDAASRFPFCQLDGRPIVGDALQATRALRGEAIQQEEVLWIRGGETRTLTASAVPLTSSAGSILGAVLAVEDVTSRKRAEAQLDQQREFNTAITRSLGEGVVAIDLNGDVTFMNEAASRMMGWQPDELLGRPLHETVHFVKADGSHYPREDCPFLNVLRTGQTARADEFLTRKDGSHFYASCTASPIVVEGRVVGVVKVFHDITERLELQRALNEQRERAEETSRHKTRLMSALSHDARTPLNAVSLATQLLEMHLSGVENAEVKDCVRTIRDSVGNVLELLKDVLDLTRIDAGAMPPELSRFELEPVLFECLSSVETQARIKGLECRVDASSLAGATVESDRAKLKQIVSNLLSNALRFTSQGYIHLHGELRKDEIRISVLDSGHGIAPDDLGRIFEEFAMIDGPQRAPGEGTGLGLAICRRLISLLGGSIEVQSELGVGSTFTLVLPTSPALSASAIESLAPPESDAPLAGGTILIAEDHVASRQILAKVLRRMGYRVLEVADGREVLAMAQREPLTAILMDVNMPVVGGVDATTALRADPKFRALAIFALTGDVSNDNRERMKQAGVTGFLEKPVTPDALRQALSGVTRPQTD